jgi:predicted transcriptional regulator YdeE
MPIATIAAFTSVDLNAKLAAMDLPPFRVCGLARRQSNDRPEEIGRQWRDFYAAGGAAQIQHKIGDDLYAVYFEYEGDHTRPYTMLLGCSVSAPTPGLRLIEIPAQRYEVFDARGPMPQTLMQTWMKVYDAPIARAFTFDFDRTLGAEHVAVHVAVR